MEAFAQGLPGNALSNGVERIGNVYEDVAVWRLHKTSGAQEIAAFSRAAVGKNAFGQTFGAIYKGPSTLKLGWDVGTYLGSAVACAAGWSR
jgi:hypothetical protein